MIPREDVSSTRYIYASQSTASNHNVGYKDPSNPFANHKGPDTLMQTFHARLVYVSHQRKTGRILAFWMTRHRWTTGLPSA
eukprot:1183751-Prorocentrum_minimum.AAC.9